MIWGEDWHEGVIGIVASRLVERFNRPVVLIAGTDGEWKGSGRSLSAFDLHGALAACSAHLRRFGGHRAAAGLSIDPAELEALRRRLRRACRRPPRRRRPRSGDAHRRDRARLGAHARPRERARAARPVRARQSRRDAARPVLRGGAADGRRGGEAPALPRPPETAATRALRSASAWAPSSTASAGRSGTTSPCRLQENRWNGTVAPQLLVRRLFDAPDGYDELRSSLGELWKAGEDAWTSEARAIFAELELAAGARRQLYESEAFRALLLAEPGARRSAA